MSMLTCIYPHKPLRKIKMTVWNHQADRPLYVWPDIWSGDLQVYKNYGHTWHWISLLRPGVIKQHKIKSYIYIIHIGYIMIIIMGYIMDHEWCDTSWWSWLHKEMALIEFLVKETLITAKNIIIMFLHSGSPVHSPMLWRKHCKNT